MIPWISLTSIGLILELMGVIGSLISFIGGILSFISILSFIGGILSFAHNAYLFIVVSSYRFSVIFLSNKTCSYQMVYTVSGKHMSKNKPTSNKFFSGNSLWKTPPEALTTRMDISSLHKHRVTIHNSTDSPHTKCTLNCYSPQLQVQTLILFRMP